MQDVAAYLQEFGTDSVAGMVRSLFKKSHPDLGIQQLVKSTLQTPTDDGIAMLISDIFDADRRQILSKLGRPALVIGSRVSPNRCSEGNAAAFPGSKFLVVKAPDMRSSSTNLRSSTMR